MAAETVFRPVTTLFESGTVQHKRFKLFRVRAFLYKFVFFLCDSWELKYFTLIRAYQVVHILHMFDGSRTLFSAR